MNNFGQRLKFLRLSRNLTQAQLAEMTGLHVATIKRLERRGTRPGLSTVINIADKLGIEPKILLGVTE